MLTSRLVQVRYARDHIIPRYLDTGNMLWLETAEQLLALFRGQEGRTRGELEDDVVEAFGSAQDQLVHQGLAKLLEDRCEFEVVSGHPPEKLREAVFLKAALRRSARVDRPTQELSGETPTAVAGPPSTLDPLSATLFPRIDFFDSEGILSEVALELGIDSETVEQGLYADLKSEQRLKGFKDITAERLLQRYNVALAQAVLFRSTGVQIDIKGESPQRYRQLFRMVKFHRLVCEVEPKGKEGIRLRLDGPLSLFSATQKYGIQLALFLPAVLACEDFQLRADLSWGPQRKPKVFTLSSEHGLVSDSSNTGMLMPAELEMFAELFRKKVTTWDIQEETEVFPLGKGTGGFWVPDFRLVKRETGKVVYLEVLGFWRRSSAEKHLQRLKEFAPGPFLLAVSDQLHIDDAELEGLPAGIHRFRSMPLPDEIARLAEEIG